MLTQYLGYIGIGITVYLLLFIYDVFMFYSFYSKQVRCNKTSVQHYIFLTNILLLIKKVYNISIIQISYIIYVH